MYIIFTTTLKKNINTFKKCESMCSCVFDCKSLYVFLYIHCK